MEEQQFGYAYDTGIKKELKKELLLIKKRWLLICIMMECLLI